MVIAHLINDYKKNSNNNTKGTIFFDLADSIVNNFPHRLENKTYLLVPETRKELLDMGYEYYLINGETMPISMTLTMSGIINKFNKLAEELGFTVITKMSEYNNDGQLFDLMGSESIIRGQKEEEKNDFPGVKIPLTLSVDSFLEKPYFPVVFKNITANRGEDKYLIENEQQLNKIISLFELPESKELNLKNEFFVQEYIKSFDGINSSIRVLTTCTGDVLASLFLVSMKKDAKKRVKKFGVDVFNPCEYLSDPSSPYYLNTRNVLSNAAAGGKVIPLNAKTSNIDANEEIVLSLHEIDTETFTLPKMIIDQCKIIAPSWRSDKGIVLGIDFVYNSSNNSWYYLETNRNPSVDGYRVFMGLDGYKKKDVKTLMHLDALTKIVESVITKDIEVERVRAR